MTDRHISLDAAIGAVLEYFPGNTINDPKYVAGKSLVEALSALPDVGGWLDIESAPRDQEILVTDGETVCSANGHHYSTGGNYIWEGSDDRGGLKELEITPTHWKPLPAPPEIE